MESLYLGDGPSQVASHVSIQDVLAILWRRLWVIALILATSLGTAAYVTKYAPKRWKSTAQLLLIQRAAPIVTGTFQGPVQGPMVDSVDTQVAMLQSYAMARRTIDWMKNDALSKGQSPEPIDTSAEQLQKSLTVSSPKETNLIDVSVEADSRLRGIELVDAISKAFVQWKKEVSQQNFLETQSSLEERLKRAAKQLADAERKELDFKRSRHMVDIPAQQAELLGRAQKSETEVDELRQAIATHETHLQTLKRNLNNANATIAQLGASGRNDSVVNALAVELNDLETKRNELKQRFSDRHPDIVALDTKIKDTRDRLTKVARTAVDDKRPTLASQAYQEEELKNAKLDLQLQQAKLATAVRTRDQAKNLIAGIPLVSSNYARLFQETATARGLYSSLQSALNVVRVNRDMASGNVQVAQFGYAPEKAFLPNHLKDMLLGAGVGILLAFSAVMLLEQSDRRLRTVEGIRRIVPGPIVGALPRMTRGQVAGLIQGQANTPLDEAYSLARANLSLALRGSGQDDLSQHQVILITSTIPGEGKSTTAANLARSMARSGKTVVLVDADMRRPTQNLQFGTDEPHGLAEVLAGQMTLDETLVASDTENLLLLHSGAPSRNPTELISAMRMTEMLRDLRQEADIIIVDTPACTVVADALLLAPHADCILHVIGVGNVDERLVRDTIEDLSAADPKAMAFFLNRVGKGRTHYGYYSYAGSASNSSGRGNRSNRTPRAGSDAPRLS